MQVTEAGVKYFRGKNNIFVVYLEDGSEVTSRILSDQLEVSLQNAHARVKAYMLTGDETELYKKRFSRRNTVKKAQPMQSDKHYAEGDIKQIFCPMWRLVMKTI